MNNINFATETIESLNNQGITSLDFCRAFAGKSVTAVLVKQFDGCGQAQQDGNAYELSGDTDQNFALLTNSGTVYAMALDKIEDAVDVIGADDF